MRVIPVNIYYVKIKTEILSEHKNTSAHFISHQSYDVIAPHRTMTENSI